MNHGKKPKTFGFIGEPAAIYINFDINESRRKIWQTKKRRARVPKIAIAIIR
jgi:hypothetical protein